MITTEKLTAMQAEVGKYCQDKGWREEEVPFLQAMALLHEEIAEAGHAWRVWGFEDGTVGSGGGRHGGWPPKPEGVGSEFADILIRALDDSGLFGLNLPELVNTRAGQFGLDDNFLVSVNTMHVLVARVSMAWEDAQGYSQADAYFSPANGLADVIRYMFQLCEKHGIRIEAEYRRKMDFNFTREYRHGGRRA
jgi:NTP pyrophosphatase (non-canonical NTP hydrolase)